MPTYRFYNSKTKTEFEDYMTISDMEKFTKKKHISLLPPTQMNIVSSVGSVDSKPIVVSKRYYLKYQKHILIVLLRVDTVKDQ